VIASIRALLLVSRPSAIGGLVVAFHVDAVEGHPSRPLPHVRQEMFEGVPPFADCNASATVFRPALVARALASITHCLPGDPCRRSVCSAGVSMNPVALALAARRNRGTSGEPSHVVSAAPAPCSNRFGAPIDGAEFGSLIVHRETSFLGVIGQAVRAALPFYFTRFSPLPLSWPDDWDQLVEVVR